MRAAADISNELIATGLSPAQTALLMELVLSLSTGSSGANPVESPEYRALENRRAWDRDRQARKREAEKQAKLASAKSTGNPPESTGVSGGNADVCSNDEDKKVRGLSVKKESKKGSRLQNCARASEPDRAFAIENGIPENRVDAEWTEFVDYWIGVPGARGVKLDWSATWRNRVRQIAGKYRGNNGHGPSSNRAHQTAGSPPTRDATVIASMARTLERRREARAADQSGDEGVPGGAGAAGGDGAEPGASRGDDGACQQLAFLPRTDAGVR